MTSKVFPNAEAVMIGDDGLIKVDGITVCRQVVRDGIIYLQFQDRDRMRASCRGSVFVEVPLDALIEKIGASPQQE